MSPAMTRRLLLALASAALVALPAHGLVGVVQLSRSDTVFLGRAAQNGHAEVEASKLALQKAGSDGVKAFAQRMLDEHTKAGTELRELAAAKGFKVSAEPTVAHKAKLKLLSSLDGARFDARYLLSIAVQAHEERIELFRKAAGAADDPDVKALAVKALPILEQQLQLARELKAATERARIASQ